MQDQPQPGWTFNPGQPPQSTSPAQPAPTAPASGSQPGNAAQSNPANITWTASEFVEHDKSPSWYLGFLFLAIVGIGAIYLITRELFSVIALGLFAVAFMVFAARKPKLIPRR